MAKLTGILKKLKIYSWAQLGSDIDGEAAGDNFGYTVSTNAIGDRIAIGAILNDGNGFNSGHVRIYSWDGTAWTQLGSDINGEFSPDNSGYSVSMNAAGDRVAIGATLNDGTGDSSGHVRVYSWDGTAWTQLGSDINGKFASDQSGCSVSMNALGDRLAIGSVNNDGGGMNLNSDNRGHVRVFSWNGTAWTQMGTDIIGEAAGDNSGCSVSINSAGNRVAIGALNNDGISKSNVGHVRVHSWNGTNWIQMGADIDGETAGDQSGFSVSMNATGDRVAIGANLNDGNGSNSGHVRVYSWNDASWTQMGTDIDGEAAFNQFGYSVSMNAAGDRIAISAISNNSIGHVRVHSWNGTNWTQMGVDIDGEATGDQSGFSVSMNAAGDRVAIGANLNDGNGSNSGHVRVYNLNS